MLYLFGDNLARVGMGGQAGEMRGEPNAVGIATLKSPSVRFEDDDFNQFAWHLARDLEPVRKHLKYLDATVVIPADGIGTGIADLPNSAPKLYDHLLKELADLPPKLFPPPSSASMLHRTSRHPSAFERLDVC